VNKYLARLLVTSAAFLVAFSTVTLRRSIEHVWRWKQSQVQIQGEVHAETPSASPSKSEGLDELRSLSPYDIEFFVNAHPQANLAELWQRLGIHRLNLAEGWQTYSRAAAFLANCNACSAESFEYDLDDESGSEVLLRIEDRFSESCRYLVFKWLGRSGSWRLIGHVDHDFGRYSMPQHLIVLSNGKAWLVIKGQGGSGSGVALYFDRLFLVDRGVLKEVMQYSSEGHQSTFTYEPEREFSGRILNCEFRDAIARIEIEFAVKYLRGDLSKPTQDASLFTKRQRAVFARHLSRKSFALDTTHSDLSQNELDAVYNIDSLTNEGFLKYNFKELSRLATGTDANRKEWLKQFLNVCKNSEEKRRLRTLLASS
jgi:hypothetical protein